ncbi:MAG: hypothetical protein ACLFUB_04990 [Cyclobacteriaceae bacterium]
MKKSVFSFYNFPLFFAAASLLLFSASCEQDDDLNNNSLDVQAEEVASDEALADDIFEDIDAISLEAAAYTENGRYLDEGGVTSASCVTRTVERSNTSGFESKVTLKFADNCEGPNGRLRSGTVVVNRKIDLNASTYTVSTTFQDFYINGRKVEGSRTLVYTKSDDRLTTVTITLTGGKVTLPDGKVISREGNFVRIIDRVSGEISLSGTASGLNRNGVAYSTTISSPLVYKGSCAAAGVFMAVSGSKTISREGKADVTVSYGEGECDKTITLSSDGREKTIEVTIKEN